MGPSHRVDAAPDADARRMLQACCGSARWVDRMLARRPFGGDDALLAAAREEWFALGREDWLEAFSHHPRLGDRESLRRRFPVSGHLSEAEQAGVTAASGDVLEALAEANRAYERRFGHLFIACAAGRGAAEILSMLSARLNNDPDTEIRIAAGEQAGITELRLRRLG